MAQTFFPVTPVRCTPGTANDWIDVNLDDYFSGLGSDVTGVIIHAVNTLYVLGEAFGLRKNGSTDNRIGTIALSSHCWAAIGVDSNHIFEAYVGNTTFVDIYIVGYTKTGVTFFTNAYDKSLSTTNTWTDIDCHVEAPGAIGLIFEINATSESGYPAFALRKNGSTDNINNFVILHSNFGHIVGCDANQICEGWILDTILDFYLVGYITDGATFNTNAVALSLAGAGAWTDLAALPANSVMGFIEVASPLGIDYRYGLRKNGSSENIYQGARYHPCGFVECDASGIIEGEVADTKIKFYGIGQAWSIAPPTAVELGAFYQQLSPLGFNMYRAGQVRGG